MFALAVMNVFTGLATGVTIAGATFGADSGLYRRCAVLLADGQNEFCGFLYSPLTALIARPLTLVSPTTAELAMTLIGVTILVTGVALETRGLAPIDRVLIAAAVLTFAPVVYELLLGQTTLLIAAALYPVVRRRDTFASGIPLGIALALAPKPLLLPVLAWMLVWRRQALMAAVLTALALTGIGVIVVGLDQYRSWLSVLTGAGRESVGGTFVLSLRNTGNFSMWPLTPPTLVARMRRGGCDDLGDRAGRRARVGRRASRWAPAGSVLTALCLLDPAPGRKAGVRNRTARHAGACADRKPRRSLLPGDHGLGCHGLVACGFLRTEETHVTDVEP